jgi:hypothetical protein
VVRRHELARFAALRASFEDEPVRIIWDRRRTDRRRPAATGGPDAAPDRRRADRRRPPPDTWRYLDFILSPDPPDDDPPGVVPRP